MSDLVFVHNYSTSAQKGVGPKMPGGLDPKGLVNQLIEEAR